MRALFLLCLASLFLPACAQTKPSAPGPAGTSIAAMVKPALSSEAAKRKVADLAGSGDREYLERAYGLILARDPETAYAYGISRVYAVPEDELSDLSDSFALGTRELYLSLKAETDRRLAGPDGKDALALSAFSRWLGDKARDIEFSLAKYPVSPYVNSADQLALAYFTEFRTVRDAGEAERYISCLGRLPAKMAGLAAALDLRTRSGVVLPRGIYEYTLQGVKEIADAPARSSPFFEAFERKLSASSVPAGPAREALLAKAEKAVEKSALPAWKSLAAALERQGSAVPAEGGASRLPRGAEYYATCLARLTTTDLAAEEIHELGKKELARVQAEIRSRFAARGYPQGLSLTQAFTRLGGETGALSGRELLGRIDAIMKAMQDRLGEVVLAQPRCPVEAVWGESGGYYQAPSTEGDRPGRYFVAAGDRRYAYDVATTVYHETLPGHHLQIAKALESDAPGFLRGADFLGFSEGWALYAERLASEMGAYAGDPAGDLGRLRMEALRAARLVADTGINAKGWTFSQALSFLRDNTGLEEGMIRADATRYVIDPGQATAYYVGMLEILRLREECRSGLGPAFDRRRFHELVLGSGAMPLSLLARRVEDFIAAEKAR